MRKFLFAFLTIAMLLSMSGFAMAQDVDPCAGLSTDDCAIITAAEEAATNLSSATFNFDVNILASDDAQSLELAITGNGAYSGVMSDMAMDPMALNSSDPMVALEALGDLLAGFAGDLNISILLPPEAAAGMPMSTIDLQLRLIDGIGYLNFGTLAPLLGGEEVLTQIGLPTGWAGLDIPATLEELAAFAGGMEQPGMEEGTEGADSMDMEAMGMLGAEYVTITRVDDNAEGAAVFETVVDLAGMASDPAFTDLIIDQVEAQGTMLSDEERAELEVALPAILDAVSVTVTQAIDQSSFYTTSLAVDVNVDGPAIDAAAAAATGEETMSSTPDFSINMVFNFADFNAAPAIEAPADAPVATFSDLFGLLMMAGSMGQ